MPVNIQSSSLAVPQNTRYALFSYVLGKKDKKKIREKKKTIDVDMIRAGWVNENIEEKPNQNQLICFCFYKPHIFDEAAVVTYTAPLYTCMSVVAIIQCIIYMWMWSVSIEAITIKCNIFVFRFIVYLRRCLWLSLSLHVCVCVCLCVCVRVHGFLWWLDFSA